MSSGARAARRPTSRTRARATRLEDADLSADISNTGAHHQCGLRPIAGPGCAGAGVSRQNPFGCACLASKAQDAHAADGPQSSETTQVASVFARAVGDSAMMRDGGVAAPCEQHSKHAHTCTPVMRSRASTDAFTHNTIRIQDMYTDLPAHTFGMCTYTGTPSDVYMCTHALVPAHIVKHKLNTCI